MILLRKFYTILLTKRKLYTWCIVNKFHKQNNHEQDLMFVPTCDRFILKLLMR